MGVNVPLLFESPFRSASLGEFWTRRWNIAASELFRRFSFAPLARRSVALAVVAAFVVSAAAHALLAYAVLGRWRISLVCGVFFLVQPVLILTERAVGVRRWPKSAGRLWTFAALAIASPLFVEPALQIVQLHPDTRHDPILASLAVLGFAIGLSCVIALFSRLSSPAVAATNAL